MRMSLARRPSFAVAIFALVFSCLASAQKYHRTDLTVDVGTVSPSAPNVDKKLVNPWGLARGSGGPWWVSDNGSGLTTLYNASGAPFVPPGATEGAFFVVPTPDGTGTSAPTGTVFNATSSFLVGPGAKAIFLFCTEDGTISGWNPGVNPNSAVIVKNRAGKAIYKGCAIASIGASPFFYVTNFQSGRVEIYNGNFVRSAPSDDDAFRFPGLGKDWAPFGIQNVGGNLLVTFAHRAPGSHDEDHGAGLGHVAVFDSNGRFLMRLQDGPWFNAPWGIATGPGDFGKFTHRLLIGNFGDGTIHGFNLFTGKHEGAMIDDTTGMTLSIPGLWALSFGGDAVLNGPATTLYFSAGANDEADGIFGNLTASSAEQPGNSQ
jgi:uncharacterized protein (TIGR03118 family)